MPVLDAKRDTSAITSLNLHYRPLVVIFVNP
jgi:hypothetical protein